MTRKKRLYMFNTDATIVHASNTVTFLPQLFSIHKWLNPWIQNSWIQRANYSRLQIKMALYTHKNSVMGLLPITYFFFISVIHSRKNSLHLTIRKP